MAAWPMARAGATAPGRSRLADAIRHAAEPREGFGRFPDDGRLEVHADSVDRAIRPIACDRKTAFPTETDSGGERRAVVASLIETGRLGAADLHAGLTDVLERFVAGHPRSRIDDLARWATPPGGTRRWRAADAFRDPPVCGPEPTRRPAGGAARGLVDAAGSALDTPDRS